jgi:hypothetical protein
MSISGISTATPSYSSFATNQQNPVQQSFSQLMQAIQSGNLQAAQQAYTTLTQNAPQNPNSQNSPFGQAISQIGAALSSGNIGQAQSTLQSLQSQMQAHRGGHHHHRGTGSVTNASTSISTATLAFSLTPPVDAAADGTGTVNDADDASVNLLA